MKVFCTSKNSGPSYNGESVTMLYLGTSEMEATKAVGESMSRYPHQEGSSYWPKNYPESYSALPATLPREIVHFFGADGWWVSIVMFDLV